MRSLSDIQNQVRVYVRDSTFTIVNNDNSKHRGLDMSNQVYRKLANIYKWPEFSRVDTSLTTTPGVSSYRFPTTSKFQDVYSIEILNDDGNYELITPVITELDWDYFSRQRNNFPSVYRTQSVVQEKTIYGTVSYGSPTIYNTSVEQVVKQIAFAPNPSMAKTVRIRGLIEPTEFVDGDSLTSFSSNTTDDVLEFLIAAERVFKQNMFEDAINLVQRASSLLKTLTGREIPPEEIDPRVAFFSKNAS